MGCTHLTATERESILVLRTPNPQDGHQKGKQNYSAGEIFKKLALLALFCRQKGNVLLFLQ